MNSTDLIYTEDQQEKILEEIKTLKIKRVFHLLHLFIQLLTCLEYRQI